MKKVTSILCLTFLCTTIVCGQHTVKIEGKIKNMPDQMPIVLMLGSSNAYSPIAYDTVRNGKVSMSYTFAPDIEMPVSLYMKGPGDGSDAFFWASEGITSVSGYTDNISNWAIKNSTPEQKQLTTLDTFTAKYKAQIKAADKDRAKRDSLYGLVYVDQLKYLLSEQELAQSSMQKLSSIARFGLIYSKSLYDHRDLVQKVYDRLTDTQKRSAEGATVWEALYSQKKLGVGDMLPEYTALCDTAGVNHPLSEFKGKYVLFDVWSISCGPYIKAGPELREVQQKYGNSLTIIGINVDKNSGWKSGTRRHNISWTNLSDGMGQSAGFCSYLNIDGAPYYVLVDPEGRIVDQTSGYDKGSVKAQVEPWLDRGDKTTQK